MNLRAQLQTDLDQRVASEFLDVALDAVRRCQDGVDAQVIAAWALEQAAAQDEDPRSAPLLMVAGAAAARAAQLSSPAPDAIDEDTARTRLEALQDSLDAARQPARALEDFAPLGARLLCSELPRYFDMQLRTEPDDTVFLWTSGVMALKQGG